MLELAGAAVAMNIPGRTQGGHTMAKWLLGGWMLVMACAGIGSAHAQTVEYIHTDALGTPVAVTDVNRNVIERNEYEPYGALLNRPISDGPGYAGHVMDAATGLSYMQQRYYDLGIGRFLSVDPVTADGNTGGNFNRYKYAANNPYRFFDPDGRKEKETEEKRVPVDRRSLDKCLSCRGMNGSSVSLRSAGASQGKSPSLVGQVAQRLLMGSVASNANMKSTHPSRIDQNDANKIAVQGKLITLGGAAGVASAPILGPIAAEGAVATGIALNAKTAREVIYAGCIAVGVCEGRSPSGARGRQEERIQQAREGALRESKRNEYELPEPRP